MSATFSQPTPQTVSVDTTFIAWGEYEAPVILIPKREAPVATPGVPTPGVPTAPFSIRLTFCKPGTSEATPDYSVEKCALTQDNGKLIWAGRLTVRDEGSNNTLRVYKVIGGSSGAAADSVTVTVTAGSPALPPPPPDTTCTVPPPAKSTVPPPPVV